MADTFWKEWLKRLGLTWKAPPRKRRRKRVFQPRVEELEPRELLSSFLWTGAALDPTGRPDPNWTNPLDWKIIVTGRDSHKFPQDGDAAFFGLNPQQPNATVNPAAGFTGAINLLFVAIGYSGTITLQRDLKITQELELDGGTIAGPNNLLFGIGFPGTTGVLTHDAKLTGAGNSKLIVEQGASLTIKDSSFNAGGFVSFAIRRNYC